MERGKLSGTGIGTDSDYLGELIWKKALGCRHRYSDDGPTGAPGFDNARCVEVAHTNNGTAIRDSTLPASPVLHFAGVDWAAFKSDLAEGKFDLPQ